jgi:para-nitrobenzyl esterase
VAVASKKGDFMALVVETRAGSVEGRVKNDVLLFAGIPFAAPPVGDLRFAPPVRHPGWTGVHDATRFGAMAPQGVGATSLLAGAGEAPHWSEDCLFLNVQTSALDGRRPVMVWIHGGGFTSGAGSVPWYNGASFVRNGDVVVVSINYRLGAFGWSDLGVVDPAGTTSGNAGLLDQVMALEWVRDNIAAFGGDPGNVTVFGESAGGMSVATLMGIPGAAGLFQRAIAQSGAAHSTRSADQAHGVTERLLAALGVDSVGALRAVDAEALLAAQQKVEADLVREPDTGGLLLPYCPVVDGTVVPGAPLDAIAAGSAAGVALLTGTTRDEWNLFAIMGRSQADEETLVRRLGRVIDDPRSFLDIYRKVHDGKDHNALWSAIMTDRVFRIPCIKLAETQAHHQPNNTFHYQFDFASPSLGGRLGSCHALEIPFVFDNLHQPGVEFFAGPNPPQSVADAMHRSWIAFAHGGDPNHDGLPTWPAYDETARATMHFDVTSHVTGGDDADVRALWHDIGLFA